MLLRCIMSLCANRLRSRYRNRANENIKELHIWSSGFKSLMTWQMKDTLQECREACGGQGYKSENRIGIMKGSFDVLLTYEGDNLVLLQQVSRVRKVYIYVFVMSIDSYYFRLFLVTF
jgi:acyl-CoA oxidase